MLNAVYEVTLNQRLGGVQVVNTLKMRDVDGAGTALLLANDFAANIIPTWRGIIGNAVTFQNVTVSALSPATGELATNTINLAGSVGAEVDPVVCAGVITWRTARAGRRYRGRIYIAGLQHSGDQLATYNVTNVGRMQTLAAAIILRYVTNAVATKWQAGVWSRKNASLVGTPGAIDPFQPMTTFTVQSYVATMGSRRFGRGN